MKRAGVIGLKAGAWLIGAVALMVAVLWMGYAVTWHIMSVAPQENRTGTLEVVRLICDSAYDNQNDATWSVCYDAQESSGTEYVCEKDAASSLGCAIKDKREKE